MNKEGRQQDGFLSRDGKSYVVPFMLITTLFALWGFANDITNPMVAAFQTVMEISAFKASLIQFAFYGGYATMAIPAALFIRRFSYKSGILLGLALYAIGAFMFIPAANHQMFSFFCISLYVLTFGLAFLETTANPFVLSLGSHETATRRLNLAQAFNPMGSLLGMAVASQIVLPQLKSDQLVHPVAHSCEYAFVERVASPTFLLVTIVVSVLFYIALRYKTFITMCVTLLAGLAGLVAAMATSSTEAEPTAFSQLSDALKNQIRVHDLDVIRNPYVGLGVVVSIIFVVIALYRMPNTNKHREIKVVESLKHLMHNKAYREGVASQIFYVAAQIMVWTFIIQYAERLGMDKSTAQRYNIIAMSLFLCSRFLATYLMKYVRGSVLLAYFGSGAALCTLGAIAIDGVAGLYCLVGISAFMSLMFPTIYGIALDKVAHEDTTLGAAFLVMAIVGGALMPPMQGAIIDQKELFGMPAENVSFVLPFICFLVIITYGIRCARKKN